MKLADFLKVFDATSTRIYLERVDKPQYLYHGIVSCCESDLEKEYPYNDFLDFRVTKCKIDDGVLYISIEQ